MTATTVAQQGTPPTSPPPKPKSDPIDRILDVGIYIALGVLVIVFSIASPYFLTVGNLLNIGQAVAQTGILAAGVTIALIAGQLDISFGSVIAVTAVLVAVLTGAGLPAAVAVLGAVVAGLLVGILNGVLIVNLNISSIISTLAVGTAVTGAAYLLANGQVIPLPDPAAFSWVNVRVFGLPVPMLIAIAVYVAGWVLLAKTKLGAHIYAVGGNSSAALRAGIPVKRIYYTVLVISSSLAVLAGVIVLGRTGAGDPSYGAADMFTVLGAVLLSGIGLGGGTGSVQRTFVGVLIIGVLANGLVLLGVQSYYQQLVNGAVLVLAVVMEAIRRKRRSR
ncbi:ABC transporter permease [Agromyces sp. H66]|uniref:ABC transporter permease n=1 Tax=Agromyces sp. H66 TaxID=2529859 RepID=UPI0010AA6BC5|nr:ABC transporter permease [Agromyces sp. H66]